MSKLSEFSQLAPNWDSYGSNRVSKDALKMALRFLAEGPIELIPEPNVSPVPGGGLGFHWRVESRDLELEFLADGRVEYLKTIQIEGKEIKSEEGTLQELEDVRLWYWLAGELA